MQESGTIFSVQESLDGGFEARALGHDIFTEADSLGELRQMVRDAVRCHSNGEANPSVPRLHFVNNEVSDA
jgi:hypothetical protein